MNYQHKTTIATRTGYTYEYAHRPGACDQHVDQGHRCKRAATRYVISLANLDRGAIDACYCAEHGGDAAALESLGADWLVLAPPIVGDRRAVRAAGERGLTTREAYAVIRPEVHPARTVWLAWLGLGSYLTPVANPNGAKLDKLGKVQYRTRRGKRVPVSASSFPDRGSALAAVLVAWRGNRDRVVAEITRERGGTLAWGVPVEPIEEPIVIELDQHGSAWDVAEKLPRRTREGLACMSGVRPSGEVA